MELCLAIQSIHWETTKEIIGLVTSLIGSLAGLGAVCIAYKGLHTWKKQLIGTEKHLRASALVRAAFEFRARFNEVRHPTLLATELLNADAGIGSLKRNYPQGFESLQQARLKLEEAVFEAQVNLMFKEDQMVDLMNGFLDVQHELRVAIENYSAGQRPMDLLWVVYKPSEPGKDEIGKRLNKLVDRVKDLSTPFLK